MYCPKCGHKNPDDAVFCMKCGENISLQEKQADSNIDPQTGKKKSNAIGILLFFAIFALGPLLILMAFHFPMGVGLLWIAGMFAAAILIKVHAKNWWVAAIVLGFLVFMATVTDQYGNPISHHLVKSMYCSPDDQLIIKKHVSHPAPGETNLNYAKYCVSPNGDRLKLNGWRNISSNFLFFLGIGLFMFILNRFICYLKFSRQTINQTFEQPY